ncbi:hypothetical protein D3C76_1600080 [compost metagenome]
MLELRKRNLRVQASGLQLPAAFNQLLALDHLRRAFDSMRQLVEFFGVALLQQGLQRLAVFAVVVDQLVEYLVKLHRLTTDQQLQRAQVDQAQYFRGRYQRL